MTARQIIVPGAQPSRDANGRSLPAVLRFFAPDTAYSTPKAVYTSSALTTPHPFELLSDSAGRFDQIWAEEAEYFDVTWSRQDNGAAINSFENIRPLSDALIASAILAEVQAGLAEASADAAAQSAEDAETAADSTEGVLDDAEAIRAATEVLRDETEAFRNQAEAIVGFDPTDYVSVGVVQSYTAPEKAQARSNIGAAGTDTQTFTGPTVLEGAANVEGLLTAEAGLAVTGAASVTGASTLGGGAAITGKVVHNVVAAPALNLDLASALFFTKSIGSNSAFTFSNATAAMGQVFVLELTISSSAVPSWPASVDHGEGDNPSATLGNGRHVLGFITFDGGTTWTMTVGSKAAA